MTQNKKRRQHHVWQRYLKAWATNDQLFCLHNGRIFPTGTSSVAVERDFYKMQELMPTDIALIRLIAIDKAHPYAKELHEEFLGRLAMATQAAKAIRGRKGTPRQLSEMIDVMMTNVLEDYHGGVEQSFLPLLERINANDLSFYSDEQECITFLHYIVLQYMRTKGIKVRTIELNREQLDIDMTRIMDIMNMMFAVNIGAGLYVERTKRPLYLVENRTEVPFITGDQPAINLLGTGPIAPEKLSIYYPISPTLGLFLGDVEEEPVCSTESFTAAQASELNAKIARAGHSQLFGHSKASLAEARELLSTHES